MTARAATWAGMTARAATWAGAAEPAHPDGPVLDLVVPVYNEEADLATCVRRVHQHLSTSLPYRFQITIADNASTDATASIAEALAVELAGVRVLNLAERGRGRALRAAWSSSPAPVLAYLDVDLSTDLAALLPLVAPLISGHSDLAIGTRLARDSRVVRGFKREAISRGYNLVLRATLATRFSDAQCGFKAIRAEVAQRLLPLVEDTGWFFDTELLVLAQRSGLRIHEVPVDWVDDPDSRVQLLPTAIADLRGIARLARALATGALPLRELREQLSRTPVPRRAADCSIGSVAVPVALPRQLASFAAIGVVSTLAYLLLFAVLRAQPPGLHAQAANLIALLCTAVANTAANRRITFGISGRRHAWRHQLQGLSAFALGLALTSGSLLALHSINSNPSRLAELAVVLVANLAATVMRFLLLRLWLYHRHSTVAGTAV
jgi:putative flippase GtrA